MLFGDAHIEGSFGEGMLHVDHAATTCHGRGDAHNTQVPCCQLGEGHPKYILQFWWKFFAPFRTADLSGGHVKSARSMPQ